MRYFWTFLIIAWALIPLLYALYYLGFMVTRATASSFRADLSLPTRWDGHTTGTSGFMRRNFAIFKKYSALSVEVEINSGLLNFEVRAPDGSILSPATGSCGRNASVLIDVSRLRRCSVTLRMDHFNGKFRIALQ